MSTRNENTSMNYDDRPEELDALLLRVLNNTCTTDEIAFFKEWIKEKEHHAYFRQFKQIWNATTNASITPEEQKLALKHYQAYLRVSSTRKRAKLYRQIVQYAAVILLSVFIGYQLASRHENTLQPVAIAEATDVKTPRLTRADGSVINLLTTDTTMTEGNGTTVHRSGERELVYQTAKTPTKEEVYNTIQIPRGERFTLTLADGTRVWLNSESSLTYPVNFTGKERRVTLSGQAYFKVKEDTLHPFIVNSGELETRVLGTSFDICAYPDLPERRIILVEGRVQATAYQRKIVLHPNQQLAVDTALRNLSVTNIDAREMTLWKDGILQLKDQTFNEMLNKLSRWYGVTFVNSADIPATDRFNGKFNRENIREAMKTISLSAHIEVTYKQDTVIIQPK